MTWPEKKKKKEERISENSIFCLLTEFKKNTLFLNFKNILQWFYS